MKLIYAAIFTPWEDGNGFTVEVPDLPGCVTEGDDLVSAIEMGTDAACGWILGELEDGNSYPQPSNYDDIDVPDGSFKNLLMLDIDAYAEQYGSKTVRKNITIPAWLNTYGEKNHINFSRILTESLLQQASR
jgi:predicted RNase H-like HicB family nuclease